MTFEPTMHKLSNGITVLLDPMDLETTTVKVVFRTGARDEQPHEYGITHFCEHMMCKGTPRFPTQKIADEYFDVNAGRKGASTGNTSLNFHGRILAENVNVLIDFLGDQVQNSLFLPEKIEIERKVISDELRRALDNPERQLQTLIADKLLNNAVFSSRTLGTFENISGFTREQMLEFLSRRLSATNCIIGISGKINDADDILKCLEKSFGWLQPTDISENMEIEYTPTIAHNPKSDNKNVKLRIYFPDIWDNSFEHRFNNMCVGKFERFMCEELYEIIRRENGLVYGFVASGVGNEKFGLNGFSTQTSSENIEKCVALIAQNAYKIYIENKVTDDILERFSKKNKLGDADWLESADYRCNRLINFYRDFGVLYDFYDNVRMSESVRRDDVIENTRGYFDGSISIVTQGADFNADLKSIWDENFK